MNFLNRVKLKLEQALPGAVVEVRNESSQHRGHNRTGAHIGIIVRYNGFKKNTTVEQHQIIYKILEPELQAEIHSLQIKTITE